MVAVKPGTLDEKELAMHQDEFLKYITYFMMMFGFIELLFGFMALNSGDKLNMGVLAFRFFTGFCNIVGAVLILVTSIADTNRGLFVAGCLVILGGTAFIFFSLRIRNMKVVE